MRDTLFIQKYPVISRVVALRRRLIIHLYRRCKLKSKYYIFGGVIIIIILILFIYSNKEGFQFIRANEHDTAMQLGLRSRGIDKNQILFIEPVKSEEELVFFSKDNALGFACLSKNNDEWIWAVTEPMRGFQTSDTSSYMTSRVEITTIKDHNYFLYLGEIFNPKINKITLQNDKISAKIVKIDNNTFWFAVIDTKLVNNSLNIDTKAYDEVGNIIE